MKYDDASWHTGGDFPSDLPPEAGATHIAFFVAWAVLNDLGSAYHTQDAAKDLESLRLRAVTPGTWFIQACDAKFTDEDLSEAGNAFALEYYKAESRYFLDYDETFPSVPSLYHVEDNWMSFDAVVPTIRARYEAFLNSKK
jgi:hypothetical protein